MGFHNFAKPIDYVPLFPTTRSYAYRDSDLVGGNVTLWASFYGLIREKGSNRQDSPTAYNFGAGSVGGGGYRIPDVSPVNLQIQAVDWGVSNGQIYQAVNNRVGQWMMASNGYNHNDISVRVKTNVNPPFSTGLAGIQNHGQANQGLMTFLHGPTQRIRVAKLYDGFTSTVYFTGTTPITLDTFYTLRTIEVGETLSIYLNGVLEGTVDLTNIKLGSSDTSGSAMSSSPGIGLVTDINSSRFSDFYVAPQFATPAATNITVRNYDGDILYTSTFAALADPTLVTIPDSALKQRNNLGPYGWYRVYLTGPDRADNAWGTSYGDCTFARLPASNLPNHGILHQLGSGLDRIDEVGEGEWGLGSSRYSIFNVTSPSTLIVSERTPSLQLAKTWVVDTASAVRPRKLVMAWSGGSLGNESNVTAVVSSLQNLVKVWESRNEPNYFDGPDHWTTTEFIPFANAVHAGDPTATVIGPGSVSFNDWGSIFYFERFLAAGGGNYADAFSFHPYNCYQGDLAMMRYTLGKVQALMTAAGKGNYDMYMTEQGYAWMYAGVVWPHYSARWNSLMYFAQSCITADKMRPETTCYWYDGYDSIAGGSTYDSFPTSWHSASGPGPQVGPVRTMSAEIFGKTFTSELDFGTYGSNLYVGGIWTNPSTGVKVLGIQAASYGANTIRLRVTGATNFTLVDPWGNTSTITAVGGDLLVPMHELTQWIRLPAGVTAALEPTDWAFGANACLTGTVATSATSNIQHLNYVNDDIQNNGYVRGFNEDVMQIGVFGGADAPFPTTVDVNFASQPISRIIVHALPPWQRYGTLTDFDLQVYNGTTWTTVHTWVSDLTRSFYFTSGAPRGRIETYWQDQYIFDHQFTAPVTCQGVRCLVRKTSYGAFDTRETSEPSWGSNGQGGGGYLIHIREIQAFNTTGAPPAPPAPPPSTGRNPAMGGVLR